MSESHTAANLSRPSPLALERTVSSDRDRFSAEPRIESVDERYIAARERATFRTDLGFNPVPRQDRVLRYPDFLVIGAQKAGTTWLAEQLSYHPMVWLTPAKELNYFNEVYGPSPTGWEAAGRISQVDRCRGYYETAEPGDLRKSSQKLALDVIAEPGVSDDWYGRIFSLAPPDTVCGEVSPEYAVLPAQGLSHIARLSPHVRLILLLRDPIDRFWSHLCMTTDAGEAHATVDWLTDPYVWRIFAGRSNYPEMIRAWTRVFGRERITLLNYHAIATRPLNVLAQVCADLGLPFEKDFFPLADRKVGAGTGREIPSDILAFLRETLGFIYEQLEDCGVDFVKDWPRATGR